MPFAHTTLEEIDQSVLRPIVLDIVDQVKTLTGIPKSVPIYFPGEIGVVAPPGTEVGSLDKENTVLFAAQKSIHIEVEEDYDIDHVLATPMGKSTSTPIFVDVDSGIYIVPAYIKSDVTIHFKYTTHSKTEALKWRENMRMRASQGGDINMHDIHYHYIVPQQYIELLRQVNTMKENIAPIGESFLEYLKRCFTTRMTYITDEAQLDHRMVIKEQQTGIQGMYGFGYIPQKPSRNDDTGTWTIEFDYTYHYERPAFVRIQYPVMVHQQLMPTKYVDHLFKDTINPFKKDVNASGYRAATSHFDTANLNSLFDAPTRHLPEFDIYVPLTKLAHWHPVLTVLVTISEADKRNLFNLKNMGELQLHPTVIELLESGDYSKFCSPYKSLYTACLYENDTLMPVNILECDSSLNMKASIDLNVRRTYRVVIGVNTHVGMIDPVCLEKLIDKPEVANTYIEISYSNVSRILRLNPSCAFPIKTKGDLNLMYWLMTGKPLFFDPKDLVDTPSSMANFIVTGTRLSDSMKDLIRASAANAYKTSVYTLTQKTGLMNSQYILAMKNMLTVMPRVMRAAVVVRRKF